MKKHMLVIDDDPSIVRLLNRFFGRNGYDVTWWKTPGEINYQIAAQADVILLDLVMPDTNGFDLLERLRSRCPNVGIILISGNQETDDKIEALERGVDDYVCKPFDLNELLARVKRLDRLIKLESKMSVAEAVDGDLQSESLYFDGWRFELRTRFLYSPSGEYISLTSYESNLLWMFLNSSNRSLSRADITRELFRREWSSTDRGVDNMVSKLRKKLGNSNYIVSDRTLGYRFTAKVEKGAGKNMMMKEDGAEPKYQTTYLGSHTKKILIVDDDKRFLDMFQRILAKTGLYDVVTEQNPFNVLDTAKSIRPDLILLDIKMSGRSGDVIINDLRNDNATSQCQVIFLTGLMTARECNNQIKKIASCYFLAKDTPQEVMLSEIHRTIFNKRIKNAIIL